jgi:hypothetical protein
MNLYKLTALGILVELFAILGFICVAKTTLADPGKQITLIVSGIAIVALLIVAVKLLSIRELISLSVFLTVGFIAVEQTLSLAFFPGLLKDVVPFSLEHFRITGTVTIIIFGSYMGGIFLILAIKKLLKI